MKKPFKEHHTFSCRGDTACSCGAKDVNRLYDILDEYYTKHIEENYVRKDKLPNTDKIYNMLTDYGVLSSLGVVGQSLLVGDIGKLIRGEK